MRWGRCLRVRALEADGRGPFQHEVGDPHLYGDVGREIFAVAQDARRSLVWSRWSVAAHSSEVWPERLARAESQMLRWRMHAATLCASISQVSVWPFDGDD